MREAGLADGLEVVTYRPELERAFIELNTEWIKTYFRLEEHDLETFGNVREGIIATGGEVFFALDGGVAVGCCALVHHAADNPLGEWELAKMAVSPLSQGRGTGSRLMEALLAEVRRRGVRDIYLEGNTRLAASIHMYRKFGFREVPLGERNYERVDIIMRWRNPDLSAT